VARGAGWTEVALLGDDVWVMHRDRDSGELLKVRPDRQSVLEAVARSLPRPGGLYAHQDRLYWIESHAAAPENAVFVPPVGPLAVLRCREASGAVREVGVWPGGVEGADGAPAGQIVGVDGEALIVCVYRLSSTEIVSFPPSGQAPVRLAGAAGRQAAVLHGGSLYWTAPSLEAASAGRRCVRCLPLPPAGSEPRTLTDWLPGEGRLISLDTDLYYAADVLYRLSQAPGAAGALRGIPSGSVVTDGASLIHLDAAGVPNVIPAR
jgi:hypothetical protein